jgi:hypothetical protein
VLVPSGGPVFSVAHNQKPEDPIFGYDGDLVFNWWHANNGARIALNGGHLSDHDVNDDDTHGLGNEFGAETHVDGHAQNMGSVEWWHDASVAQGDCHGGSCTVQGTDHGSALSDGAVLGQYAVYVGAFDEAHIASGEVAFDCHVAEPLSRKETPIAGAVITPVGDGRG